MIQFTVIDRNDEEKTIEIPDGIGLNLMEVLKASEYSILATCGGMALCATCKIEIIDGGSNLSKISEAELDIFDTLPENTKNCRLACQIPVNKTLAGVKFKIKGELD